MKIEFSRQSIILQMASKKNGDTTDAWRSQAVSATSTQWLGKRLTISSIGRTGGGVSMVWSHFQRWGKRLCPLHVSYREEWTRAALARL